MFHVTTVPNAEGLSRALNNAGFKGSQVNAVTYDPAVPVRSGATT